MLQKNAKGFIDVHLDTAILAFDRIRESRQNFRDRTISIFTFLLALLGIIITLQSSIQSTFIDHFLEANYFLQAIFSFSSLLSIILFIIIFSSTQSTDLDNVFQTFQKRIIEIESSGDNSKPIYLFDEKVPVDEEYYSKVTLLRAYSVATENIKNKLEQLVKLYVFTLVMLLITIMSSLIIGFQIF